MDGPAANGSGPSPLRDDMDDTYAGWHLTYDGIVEEGHVGALADLEFLETALRDLAEYLGMAPLVGPLLRDVVAEDDTDTGISALFLVEGGHLTLHAWALRGRFALDVFSATRFDEGALQSFVRHRFNVKIRASHWIVRNWP